MFATQKFSLLYVVQFTLNNFCTHFTNQRHQVEDLDNTERGEGGFGSTGYHSNNLNNGSDKHVTAAKRANLEPDENEERR